ncbi:hypothetical protein HMSSN139_13570 [Paenibacillus sp. HMSSN-139]|nr:hypothetical protein HMSSN139_13570 [Paenibacillus sp. HMSSN-139]
MTLSFKSISEALALPRSRFFGVVYENGRYAANDEVSFFGLKLPDPELTFDISNNKTLVNVNMNGSIKYVTVYNGQYASDNIPGVWMCKDFRKTGPYAFGLKLGEQRVDLGQDDLPYATSLLDNLFPVTEFRFGDVQATLLVYSPISADGAVRLRGTVYGLHVENRSGQAIHGEVRLPRPDTEEDSLFSGPDVCIYPVEREDWYAASGAVSFRLDPGHDVWIPVVICPPGDETPRLVNEKGTLYWLNETWAYYRGMLGRLEMKDDPFAAEFYERAMLQSLGSIAMDRQGAVVGSNWGTYPTTEFTWNKDMYYSFLPFHTAEPELFKLGALWFLEHGVRPVGNRYPGGISHSLSNSLSSVVMAGLYYRSTGDKRFFLERLDIDLNIRKLLEEMLRTRKPDAHGFSPRIGCPTRIRSATTTRDPTSWPGPLSTITPASSARYSGIRKLPNVIGPLLQALRRICSGTIRWRAHLAFNIRKEQAPEAMRSKTMRANTRGLTTISACSSSAG